MRVVYGDDKKTWHELFDKVLSLRGIEVVHAYTPKEVINLTVEKKPDVVILDVTLSHGTAYEVIEKVKDRGVPVVVIGHRAEGFDPEKALSLGASAVLEKPFTVEELVELLRNIKTHKPQLEEKLEIVAPSAGEMVEIPVIEEPQEELQVLPVEEHVETIELEPVELQPEPVEEPVKPQSTESKVVEEAKKEIAKKVEAGLPEEKVEQIIREIAWEVIPEIAEKVIREEVEKLIKSRLA
ncbi:response regulator transcription factor [Thermovibrio ammonificans]|jgi:DNA-binding response OmpR family regulator|uniref:Response regulator receiver protein n=1 Tax=Thermovibrio ammonificans (strain DSM 15698 / JCM 12110 / HB-1) TaxID=648996 RepID=E8T603_THEA1|nr:response regulator [Thermovibrio ammonificans]ADU96587.1 response regulator receiver protein [Thermovibrio ammonificans HB-1]